MEIVNWAGMFYEDLEVICSWPLYEEMQEIQESGKDSVGAFLKDPNAPENANNRFVVYCKPVE